MRRTLIALTVATLCSSTTFAQQINNSPQTAFDATDNRVNARQRLTQGNVNFLDQQAKQGVTTATAGRLERPDAIIPQGTIIHGVLETAIQSDLPGVIRATVSEDVWSLNGQRMLVPKGSRLIGEYQSGIQTGQTRVLIAWNRVITGDGISVQLGSSGADALGRAGVTGQVDKHNFERFGSAILLTVLGGVSQFIGTLGQEDETPSVSVTTIDPVTGGVVTTTTDGNQDENEARQIAAQAASQSLSDLASTALEDNLNIAPTIHVDQGVRIIVMVRQDLDFSELYLDPVIEEYNRLKNPQKNAYK